MSITVSSNPVQVAKEGSFPREKVKKAILIAISVLMALGMVLSYALGAPWLTIAGFFVLTLAPLFSIGLSVDRQRPKITN